MRLDTKEKRLEYRKSFISRHTDTETTIIDFPEIQFQAFTTDNPNGKENYYTLTTFIGTAAKPSMNYYYKTKERRDAALQEAIDDQKKRLAYKTQRKVENKGHQSDAAATAAAIRTRLKKEFPGIKFSVTSENFSMGNSVNIDWTDGPRLSDVQKVGNEYQSGHFDGMMDYYEHRSVSKDLGCPGAKYVHAHRTITDAYAETLIKAWEEKHGYEYNHKDAYDRDKENRLIVHEIEKEHPELMPYQYATNQPQPQKEEKVIIPEAKAEVINEIQPEPTQQKPSNIIDITDRIKNRQAQQEGEKTIQKFKTHYLPLFTKEDINLILNSPESERTVNIVKICMRIDMERQQG